MSLSVSVIIPNYNGKALLEKNILYVIEAYKNKANAIKEIIVVDDHSSDDSIEFLKSNYPFVRLIKHTKHRGVSAGMNTGARASKGEYLALINNDVAPNRDFLVECLPHFKDKNIFAVSFNEKGYGYTKGVFKNGYIVFREVKTNKTSRTFWASGGSAVFRRKLWMDLGGMDEKLLSPFYWEDIDLCYRAQKRGWKILWEPKSVVVHEHESTTGKFPKKYRQRIQERNQLLFVWKNLGSSALFKKHIVFMLNRAFRHPGYFVVIMMALAKLRTVIMARRKEIKESKVSDETIFGYFS